MGGIEAEAVMLGQAISMVVPEVVGYKITGNMKDFITSTDVVLTITKVKIVIIFIITFYVRLTAGFAEYISFICEP